MVQEGTAEADKLGPVTVRKLEVTKGRHRIAIAPSKAGRWSFSVEEMAGSRARVLVCKSAPAS